MKRRATALRVDEVRLLDHWCESMVTMFPDRIGVYHVGSSVTGETYRDVDVRIVLTDAAVDQLAAVLDISDLNMLLSRWGQQSTGLPVDAQVQSLRQCSTFPAHERRPRGHLHELAHMGRSEAPDVDQGSAS